MKLALHRSIIFWSGLLVMGFIVWAWAISYDHRSWVNFESYALANTEGYASVGHTWIPTQNDAGHSKTRRGQYRYERVAPPFIARGKEAAISSWPEWGQATYKEVLTLAYSAGPAAAWGVFVPHWLLLLGSLLFWMALLCGRARRRKRMGTPLQEAV
ncbi:hypothetical protein [Haloferula sp. BvORR071]|uniref:hypothetical protein n=1 Tax=Haloferula sp. BvORR071 TaxID=1396141 RepID=UPI002240EC50|nr:hypothetical protein [Haloferula sp. BvORR071]